MKISVCALNEHVCEEPEEAYTRTCFRRLTALHYPEYLYCTRHNNHKDSKSTTCREFA